MLDLSQVKAESLHHLLTTPLPDVDYYIEPALLPKGAKMLFGGTAKLGKSFLGLGLGRALALGKPLWDMPEFKVPKPVRVLLLEQEVGKRGVKKRCEKVFNGDDEAKLKENFHVLSQLRGFRIDNYDGIDFLDRVVHETGANVLILDPIGKMHGFDENDNTQITKLFFNIETVLDKCSDLNLSIVISHHYGKPVRDPKFDVDHLDPYNFRGASKWFDDPDSLITCYRIPKDNGGKVGSRGWKVEARCTLRHGEEQDDMVFHINEDDDLRVKYAGPREMKQKKEKTAGPKKSSLLFRRD